MRAQISRTLVLSIIKKHQDEYKEEKKRCRRWSPGWSRADSVLAVLEQLRRQIKILDAEMPK